MLDDKKTSSSSNHPSVHRVGTPRWITALLMKFLWSSLLDHAWKNNHCTCLDGSSQPLEILNQCQDSFELSVFTRAWCSLALDRQPNKYLADLQYLQYLSRCSLDYNFTTTTDEMMATLDHGQPQMRWWLPWTNGQPQMRWWLPWTTWWWLPWTWQRCLKPRTWTIWCGLDCRTTKKTPVSLH